MTGTLFDHVAAYFAATGWMAERIRSESALRLAYEGSILRWTCLAIVREQHREFVFYSVHPHDVPEEARAAVGEYLGAANWGLAMGGFEMERRTGEIRFRTSVGLGDAEVDDSLLTVVVEANLVLMDRYAPGIDLVIAGTSVDEALAACEPGTS